MFRNYEKWTDEKLMRHVQRGKEAAFNVLYARYGSKLYVYFFRSLNQDRDVAEDFTQQLFLKLIEGKATYKDNHRFSAWLLTIAANMVKNEYRRRGRQQQRALRAPERAIMVENNLLHLDSEYQQAELQRALDHLNPAQRQVFLLRYQEEMSIKEISAICACPEGTVKSRLHHAIKLLARQLENIRSL